MAITASAAWCLARQTDQAPQPDDNGIIIPLLGLAGFLLLRGLEGLAATVSRVALVFFLVFYTAYEVTVGVGTGLLVDYANSLTTADQAVVADAIQDLVGAVKSATEDCCPGAFAHLMKDFTRDDVPARRDDDGNQGCAC